MTLYKSLWFHAIRIENYPISFRPDMFIISFCSDTDGQQYWYVNDPERDFRTQKISDASRFDTEAQTLAYMYVAFQDLEPELKVVRAGPNNQWTVADKYRRPVPDMEYGIPMYEDIPAYPEARALAMVKNRQFMRLLPGKMEDLYGAVE